VDGPCRPLQNEINGSDRRTKRGLAARHFGPLAVLQNEPARPDYCRWSYKTNSLQSGSILARPFTKRSHRILRLCKTNSRPSGLTKRTRLPQTVSDSQPDSFYKTNSLQCGSTLACASQNKIIGATFLQEELPRHGHSSIGDRSHTNKVSVDSQKLNPFYKTNSLRRGSWRLGMLRQNVTFFSPFIPEALATLFGSY
jgi:hypothetical protein